MAVPRKNLIRRHYEQKTATVLPFILSQKPITTKTKGNTMAKRAEAIQLKSIMKHNIRLNDLYKFTPLTDNQTRFFEHYNAGIPAIMLHGVAGTGKTFIAMYKALEQILSKQDQYKHIYIVRSAVQTRDIGFLPGTAQEKTAVFELPYVNICNDLFGRDKNAYQRLVEQGTIEFMITSFLRGITLDNCIIIVDEAQNMTRHELASIFTRLGESARIVVCGDFRQTDLSRNGDVSGLKDFLQITNKMSSFRRIEFQTSDIVRSNICREFIEASLAYDDEVK